MTTYQRNPLAQPLIAAREAHAAALAENVRLQDLLAGARVELRQLRAANMRLRNSATASDKKVQQLTDRLAEARETIRELRADKVRLQARNANLKRYRPHAPHELSAPRDEAEQRLLDATNEASTWHRKRRAA